MTKPVFPFQFKRRFWGFDRFRRSGPATHPPHDPLPRRRLAEFGKMGLVWALAMVVALPSMGSRLEDGTLTDPLHLHPVRASLDGDSPILRNVGVIVSAKTYGVQPYGLRARDAQSDLRPRAEPHSVALDQLVFLARSTRAAVQRPVPRPEGLALAHAASRAANAPVSLSTSGAMAAPIALGSRLASRLAPVTSVRPVARPKGMERRMVQYSASWLRRLPARELSEQEQCLATAIYHESRGEGIKGQFAVAEVVLNRVASRKFPGSICGVVFQGARAGQYGGCQFSFACDGAPDTLVNRRAADIARRIAQVMADGGHRGLTAGATYFHTHAVNPSWSARFTNTTRIGAHLFYRG